MDLIFLSTGSGQTPSRSALKKPLTSTIFKLYVLVYLLFSLNFTSRTCDTLSIALLKVTCTDIVLGIAHSQANILYVFCTIIDGHLS